jgi:hypothetical protein
MLPAWAEMSRNVSPAGMAAKMVSALQALPESAKEHLPSSVVPNWMKGRITAIECGILRRRGLILGNAGPQSGLPAVLMLPAPDG